MSFEIVEKTLSAAVATSGTIAIEYPAGTDAGSFQGAIDHTMWAAGHQKLYTSPTGFTVSFGASEITVTYLGATSLPADKRLTFQFNKIGALPTPETNLTAVKRTGKATPVIVNIGAPATADADGVCASQGATNFTINGALAVDGVVTLDVPRNIVAAWTTTAVLTVTGTDEYGKAMVEVSASGTSFTGKKAFKTITSVVASTAVTSATVGTGVLLGMPFRLKRAGDIAIELQDGAKVGTAGALIAGIAVASTNTGGDVRGTYSPNAAPNGSRAYALHVLSDDPSDLGYAQYAG